MRILCLFGIHKLREYPKWLKVNIWSFWGPSAKDKKHYTAFYECQWCGKLVKKKMLDEKARELLHTKHYENVSDPEDSVVFYELVE
ncbi:MAG: hypothetical protein QW521_02030 [Desulfurococcaceae archaeon]